MTILALEFSSPARSVAVLHRGVICSRSQEHGRETKAFQMIVEGLQEAGAERDEIECIAVGTGPGSYAGIRIAIAIAQGWRIARGVRLVGIRSADAIAAQLHAADRRGWVNVVIDAQRGEHFAARYELAQGAWRLANDFAILADDERARRAAAGELIVRPDLLEGPEAIHPTAATIAGMAHTRSDLSSANLEPIYLRQAEFVKAPPPRVI